MLTAWRRWVSIGVGALLLLGAAWLWGPVVWGRVVDAALKNRVAKFQQEAETARLQAEADTEKKRKIFDGLKVYLTIKESSVPYSDAAERLEMSEGAVRVAVHRLRRRYRKLLRDEIAQTIGGEDQIDEEMGCLFAALAY